MRLHLLFGVMFLGFIFQKHNADCQDLESSYVWNRDQIVENLTLLENQNNLIPVKQLDTLRIAAVSMGVGSITPFQQMLANYAGIKFFHLPLNSPDSVLWALSKQLTAYNLIIVGVHNVQPLAKSLINSIQGKSIVAIFNDTTFITEVDLKADGLILANHNDELSQELAAQMIFGGIGAKGKLSAALGKYPAGFGFFIDQPIRLSYSVPEAVGINSASLMFSIDSIVNDAIQQQAFPGCNILIAKEGKVIFHKTYGYHTYDNIIPTSKNDLYDLASVTKVSSALPAIMKLNEEGKIKLDQHLSTYWPDWDKRLFHRSNKEDITIRELLAHQGGLIPFINFWQQTQKNGKVKTKWYRVEEEENFSHMVAPGMFIKDDFKKKVYKTIRLSKLKDRGKYVYSDLFFVMTPEIISRISGDNYLHYLDSCFYKPLGAGTITYLPTQKFSIDRIVPTEDDRYFRKRLLQGSVHDEASAVLGGISGNAGLFATANDLAKLLQMYLQMGSYGGERFLKEETLKEFIRVQYPQNNNRRGLGFDKPLLNNSTLTLKDSYPSPDASAESFGHSGYTGTFFWVDPKYQLVYIMLANRVYPNRSHTKLTELSIRTKVQQAIYNEIKMKR